jgi:hypothetical protein
MSESWTRSTVKVQVSEHSRELWIDLGTATCPLYYVEHGIQRKTHPRELNIDGIDRVIVTDWMGATPKLEDGIIEWVEELSKLVPTQWLTMSQYVDTTADWKTFDFMWNMTKNLYVYGEEGWKNAHPGNYKQYPFIRTPRPNKALAMARQNYTPRQRLSKVLKKIPGNIVGCVNEGLVLLPNFGTEQDIRVGITVPPAKHYFDSTYISCQVESQHYGHRGIVFSEKTYWHLIQGRMVLNFGPAGFYRELFREGWRLPGEIDFSWDSDHNDKYRFRAYLDTVEKLLTRSDLHEWFLHNEDIWLHNQQMLWNKPRYIIE